MTETIKKITTTTTIAIAQLEKICYKIFPGALNKTTTTKKKKKNEEVKLGLHSVSCIYFSLFDFFFECL